MDLSSYLQEWGCYLHVYNYHDATEILFFSFFLYYISMWLKQDNQKNLLGSLYSYLLLIFSAHYFELYALSTLLLYTSPLIAMLFILFHQQTLQTNFITLKNIRPRHHIVADWPAELIKSLLITLNKNKSSTCIIERGDALIDLLQTTCSLNASINHELVSMLIESSLYEDKNMWWINRQGILISLNAIWREHHQEEWISEDVKQSHKWKQEALFFSSKTDCIILRATMATRLFDVVIAGKLAEGLTAHELLTFIYKSCFTAPTQFGETIYVPQNKIYNQQQPRS